jgi:hypothetical protein
LYLELCTIIVVSLILFISWAFLKYADIPVTIVTKNAGLLEDSTIKTLNIATGQVK